MRVENIPIGPATSDTPVNIERRRRLQWAAAALGLALLPAQAALLAEPSPATDKTPAVLEASAAALLSAVAEQILPRTDTPGALDAGVPAFLARYLSLCARPAEVERVQACLRGIDTAAQATQQRGFVDLSPEAQLALLTALDRGDPPFQGADVTGFRHLKSLVLFGYYTSEPGASVELGFLPIPGAYRGNVPFADVGKAWSL